MAKGNDGPLRVVVAVAHGGADSVLFECGHRCILEIVGGRKPYPKRRRCFNCVNNTQEPVTLAEWIGERRGDLYRVYNAEAAWKDETEEARAARVAARDKERQITIDRSNAWQRAFYEVKEAHDAIHYEALRWLEDEAKVSDGFCPEEDYCEHHECRFARAVERYEKALKEEKILA